MTDRTWAATEPAANMKAACDTSGDPECTDS